MISHRLPHEPSSAGIAREKLRTSLTTLDPWGTPDRVEDAMLLLTELIANAVLHGEPDIRLDVDVDVGEAVLRVVVTDGSPVMPRPPGVPGPGRGLSIVESVADRWGVEPLPEGRAGKRVWFELKG